jgi:hypothetical protein
MARPHALPRADRGGEAFVAYPADWAKVVEVLTRRKA